MAPSDCFWNAAELKSPHLVSNWAALGPSPRPSLPWHDLQWVEYKVAASVLFNLTGFFIVLYFSGTTHGVPWRSNTKASAIKSNTPSDKVKSILVFIIICFLFLCKG